MQRHQGGGINRIFRYIQVLGQMSSKTKEKNQVLKPGKVTLLTKRHYSREITATTSIPGPFLKLGKGKGPAIGWSIL